MQFYYPTMSKPNQQQTAARVRWARHNPTKPQSFRLTEERIAKINAWAQAMGSPATAAISAMIDAAPQIPPAGMDSQPA